MEINRRLSAIAEEENTVAATKDRPAFSAEEFPGELTDRVRPTAPVVLETTTEDEEGADEYFLRENSPIQEAPSIDAATAERFRKIGVMYVRDLLRIDIDDAAQRLRHAGITAGMIRRWCAEALLVCRVTRLRPYDARILVGAGIESPQQLARLDADELRRRVESFAATSTGQVLLQAGNRYELSRLANWIHSARRWDRERYHDNGKRFSSERQDRQRGDQPVVVGEHATEDFDSRQYWMRRRRHARSGGYANGRSRQTSAREASGSARNKDRRSDSSSRDAARQGDKDAMLLKMDQESDKLRFYLNTVDPLEDAPSIGPRTAERFERIGIRTVADFLRADPETTAGRLKHRYIKAETIRQWQQQAALVCRIPQLRGHDAQILVACGIHEPETLASTDPTALWHKVEPFSDTSEGRRIIRSGKAPDFAEVYDWIQWASHARQLRAA
jgi:hypothetical protein